MTHVIPQGNGGVADVARDGDTPTPPRNLNELRSLIAQRRVKLPKRLLQAGEFALAHPQEIALNTAAEIATKAHVQPSTLVRFAQALGYSGFSDLQAIFRSHAKERWPEYNERLQALRETPGERSVGALLAGFARASTASIARVEASLSAALLEQAVDVLSRAQTIHLIGARRAFPVVTYLAYAFGKLGIVARLIDQAGGLAQEHVSLVRPNDAVLAVSFTPYTPTTIELTAKAVQQGVPVVAITDTPFSPLVPGASVWLEVAEADHVAFRSLAGTMALAMTLAVAIAESRQPPEESGEAI